MVLVRAFVHWIVFGMLLIILLSSPALAGDGVLEINQECAISGCFPGDGPGFPVFIERGQPGSYRLTGSLVNGDEAASVIVIADDHVTLDLNGFSVNGPVTCTGAGAGLACGPIGSGSGIETLPPPGRAGIVVRNGIVRGNAGDGISLGIEAWVTDVHVVSNAGTGIKVGNRSLVTDCRVERNMAGGISAAASSLVEGNDVVDGRDSGIVAKNGALLLGNVIYGNGGTAIDTATGSSGGTLIVDNSVSSNGTGANLHAADGYARNVLAGNASGVNGDQVSGGVRLGTTTNLCAGAYCPP